MPRRVGDFRGLTHLSRLRLLYAVQTTPGLTLADLADRVGLHPNTARDHLTVLEQEGLVKSRALSTGARGRPPVVFDPVENAQDSPVAARRAQGAKERGALFRKVSGRRDGDSTAADAVLDERARHQLDTLYEHLDDAGFQPALDEESLTVGLVPCEYVRALGEDGRTVCAVHVKLIEQHLKQVPGPVELRRVEPFVTPSACSVALGLAEQPTRPGPRGVTRRTGRDKHSEERPDRS